MQLLLRTQLWGIKTPRPPPTPPAGAQSKGWQVACEPVHVLPFLLDGLRRWPCDPRIEGTGVMPFGFGGGSLGGSALTTVGYAAALIRAKDGQAAGFLGTAFKNRTSGRKLFSSRSLFNGRAAPPIPKFLRQGGFSSMNYINVSVSMLYAFCMLATVIAGIVAACQWELAAGRACAR